MPLGALARAFVAAGTQSFGGGSSTFLLIRREVLRRGWLTERDFAGLVAFSQLSPGVHLVALAALVGHRLSGAAGAAVAVLAMMVPAAAITLALTVAFVSVADAPAVRAALAGVAPAAAGMTIGLGLTTARAALRRGRRAVADALVAVSAAAVLLAFPGSSVAVILAGAVLGALLLRRDRRPPSPEEA